MPITIWTWRLGKDMYVHATTALVFRVRVGSLSLTLTPLNVLLLGAAVAWLPVKALAEREDAV